MLFKCLPSRGVHTIVRKLDILFNALHQDRKRKKDSLQKVRMGILQCGHAPLVNIHWVYEHFVKILRILPSSINYMCVTL